MLQLFAFNEFKEFMNCNTLRFTEDAAAMICSAASLALSFLFSVSY